MTVENTYPWITKDEIDLVVSALEESNLSGFSGTLTSEQVDSLYSNSYDAVDSDNAFLGGKLVRRAEKEIAEICGVRYCVLLNSATSALMASIVALGLPKNSLIGLPTVSFSATVSAVFAAGHRPVYVDIDQTCTACPSALRQAISDAHLQAFIFVQWAGNCKNLAEISRVCNEKKVALIEDSSQATLTKTTDNKFNGTVGDCGIFSFNGPKNISAGEGGCVVTDDPSIAFYSRLTRNHGEAVLVSPDKVDINRFKIGFNLRPTEMVAALVIVQVSRREELHDLRLQNFLTLTKELRGYADPVDGSEEQSPYCGAFFLCSEKKGLKKFLLNRANEMGIPLFGNYPLEHWEIGRSFSAIIDIEEYPGTKNYIEKYIGIFSIAHPNNQKNMVELSKLIRSIIDDSSADLIIESGKDIFNIGRSL
tara:strand:- start:1943 stop:3208 length:1266 start_codon:yes stop_codon:yes gene_type:complete